MKTFFVTAKPQPRLRHRAAMLALSSLVLLGGVARVGALEPGSASENIATLKAGAVVVYSSPLEKGASANSLLAGHAVSFSSRTHGQPHLTVIDLGTSYRLRTVQLKFAKSGKMNVFVVAKKPADNKDWSKLVSGQKPDGVLDNSSTPISLDGTFGQFLVFMSEGDPGAFSGLDVTGVAALPPHDFADGVRQGAPGSPSSGFGVDQLAGGGSSALSEVPPSSSQYSSGGGSAGGGGPDGGNGNPAVPPESQ